MKRATITIAIFFMPIVAGYFGGVDLTERGFSQGFIAAIAIGWPIIYNI